ncbi:MAG: hypothetical protein PSX36_01850 [bacterium]|nr:hypothetical protein [bacterium]
MATTGKLFYNAVRGMSRDQMLSYIVMFTEDLELKVILNSFDIVRKAAILDLEMTSTLDEAENIIKEREEYDLFLKKLEARIMILILHQHLAKDLKNQKLLFSIDQQINGLFIEYRLEGGTNMFYCPNHNGFE